MKKIKENRKRILIVVLVIFIVIILLGIFWGIIFGQRISCYFTEGVFDLELNRCDSFKAPAKDTGKACVYNDECESNLCRYKYTCWGEPCISYGEPTDIINDSGACDAYGDGDVGFVYCYRERGSDATCALAIEANSSPSTWKQYLVGIIVRVIIMVILLGLPLFLFIIPICIGGTKWYLGNGDMEKIKKAKRLIINSLVVLGIMISLYALYYIFWYI